MKSVEIIGFKRANLGKSDAKRLRAEGNVPCVVYGGDEQIHFYSPEFLFRDIVYTDEAHFVNLNIEGHELRAILQDIQFHPVSEAIVHADFLQLFDDKPVTMSIPVHFVGNSIGVLNGGILVKKRRQMSVRALPKNMPDFIEADITHLDFHKAIKVGEVATHDFEIIDNPIASVAVVEVPRALKSVAEEEAEMEEAAELAAAAEEGEGEEGGDAKEGEATE